MKKLVFTLVTLVFCLSLSAWAEKNITILEQEQVVAAGGGSQCDADGSLAANCGWESGDFTGWTRSGDASFTGVCSMAACAVRTPGTAVANSGTWALVTGPTDAPGCLEQNVPTDPAAVYDLSFYLRNVGTPNRFQVSWNGSVIYDQNNMPDFAYTSSDALPVGDTSVFIGLTPSDGAATNLKFCFQNVPDYFFFDDVDVLAE